MTLENLRQYVEKYYDNMMSLCKEAISQCEDIVFSDNDFRLPKELVELK